jgi:hypothetical protein
MPSAINPSAAHFNCSDPSSVINNFFNLSQYACDASFFNGEHPLPLYVGYLIVVVLGIVFAAGCLAITLYDHWKLGTVETSEVWSYSILPRVSHCLQHFISAGRSIKIGLTATDIVSKWFA